VYGQQLGAEHGQDVLDLVLLVGDHLEFLENLVFAQQFHHVVVGQGVLVLDQLETAQEFEDHDDVFADLDREQFNWDAGLQVDEELGEQLVLGDQPPVDYDGVALHLGEVEVEADVDEGAQLDDDVEGCVLPLLEHELLGDLDHGDRDEDEDEQDPRQLERVFRQNELFVDVALQLADLAAGQLVLLFADLVFLEQHGGDQIHFLVLLVDAGHVEFLESGVVFLELPLDDAVVRLPDFGRQQQVEVAVYQFLGFVLEEFGRPQVHKQDFGFNVGEQRSLWLVFGLLEEQLAPVVEVLFPFCLFVYYLYFHFCGFFLLYCTGSFIRF